MTCLHAMNRIIRIVQEHRARAEDMHKDADTASPDELRDTDEWDASENDIVLRDIESVVDVYCATTEKGRRKKR